MKNCWIVIIFVVFVFFPTPAKAEKILVEVLDNVSSLNPPREYSVVLKKDINLKKGNTIEKGSIIKGETFTVIKPKRLQKDAYFIFVADSFTIPSENNKVVRIENKMKSKMKYYTKEDLENDAKEVASSTGIMAVSCFVPVLNLIVPIVQFSAGMANPNQYEHRLHSGCRALVESWPFNYCLKGNEINIRPGSTAIFYFNKSMFEQ